MSKEFADKMLELARIGRAERLLQSYVLVSREEQKARLQTVIALSVELTKVLQETIFATGLAEMAIERVIEGDWRGAEEYLTVLTFEEEIVDARLEPGAQEVFRSKRQLYEPFCSMLFVACKAARDRAVGKGQVEN